MLSHRFDDALCLAARLHRTQTRKGTSIPYLSHLMAVSALAIEYGADEDQAIAALLHDAIEDQGGQATARQIERHFGARVRSIVEACSDSHGEPKPSWRTRKLTYLSGIKTKSDDAILVTTCDKLHNASTILEDFTQHGQAVFDRFTASRNRTLWYYTRLSRALAQRSPGPLTDRLSQTVQTLNTAVAGR